LLKIGEEDHGRREGEIVWALRDLSFSVEKGEVLGIIGRNGAGKSTLLKILSRVTAPTSGQIKVKGRIASLLEVGTGFHPDLTGQENIYLNGTILGMSRNEVRRKFDEIVDFAEVERFINTPVKRYSSGMYVRLAFAVAAHLDPEILVVDEVLAVGDAEFQKKCLGKMGDVANEGRTVLFVSHNMSSVKQLCHKGILLMNGQISSMNDINSVINDYLRKSQVNNISKKVDLTDYHNPFGAHEIEVQSIELINSINDGFLLSWEEPLKLKIKIRILQKISSISFGIGVTTIDNLPLFTVRSVDAGDKMLDLEIGELELSTEIDHNLRAGVYKLLLGISSGNYNYYYNPSVCNFEISDIGGKPYLYKNNGLINCTSRWVINDSHA
jgi:lipopolysaccharide transport system ATP-binding protein